MVIHCMHAKRAVYDTVYSRCGGPRRQRSRQEVKSLNTVVVETFARGLEAQVAPPVHTDLDHLIGAWREDPEFDRAVAEFERIDDAE